MVTSYIAHQLSILITTIARHRSKATIPSPSRRSIKRNFHIQHACTEVSNQLYEASSSVHPSVSHMLAGGLAWAESFPQVMVRGSCTVT